MSEFRFVVQCHKCKREADFEEVRKTWLTPYFIEEDDCTLQTQLCPNCAKFHPRFWFKNKRIGKISQVFAPGLGACYACHTTWDFVNGHSTAYDEDSGMFPLCEACWAERSKEERLPFYRQLWEHWQSVGRSNVPWWKIKKAVMDE